MQDFINKLWYGDPHKVLPLLPLSWLFRGIATLRRILYRYGILRSVTLSVPVIIVGNISVGGTGKTPLLIYLVQLLRNAGWRPGIISRGYRGKARQWPQRVNKHSNAALVGDEAVLIAMQTGCPMAVGPVRSAAARLLLESSDCNIILSDDGLQHYALQRTVEIAVIDSERRFGNGYCLPAGPLREPVSRLRSVDLLICNGTHTEPGEYAMHVEGDAAVNLISGEQLPLQAFVGRVCDAVAGIGNPQRFFDLLRHAGIEFTEHAFPDHHAFAAADLDFGDGRPVLMTEKDAVKCHRLRRNDIWYVPVKAVLQDGFDTHFLQLLKEKTRG